MLLFFIHFKDTLEMWIFTANVLNPINIVVLKITTVPLKWTNRSLN